MAASEEKAEPAHVAAQQVFSTVELVEHILLELPLLDLVAAIRVNRFFRQVVAGSSKLQRHIHYFDTPVSSNEKKLWDANTGNLVNPAKDTIIFHPMFARLVQKWVPSSNSSHAQMSRTKLELVPWRSVATGALIQQPPATNIMVDLQPQPARTRDIYHEAWAWPDLGWWPFGSDFQKTGIRLSHFAELLEACYEQEAKEISASGYGGEKQDKIVCRLWRTGTGVRPPAVG